MEIIPRPHQEKENPSPLNSPHIINGSSNSTINGCPKPISTTRSETNPYPTTFVQADTSTFKQVVQLLTGSSETPKPQSPLTDHNHNHHQNQNQNNKGHNIPPIKTNGPKKQGFKLYERRNSLKNGLMISPLVFSSSSSSSPSSSSFSPRNKPEILSPSILDFPSLVINSPVTPLNNNNNNNNNDSSLSPSSEEEKAIAEKKFYLLPSPRTTSPQLLPLFPLTSPKVSNSS